MSLPEPLQRFPDPDTSALIEVNQWLEQYTHAVNLNRILPNTLEAVRVELTYHSNAIEGSTLTLRDTQLVVEGREPNSGKSLREIYEARNHDRALRMIESWAVERRTQLLTDADILAIHAEIMADIDPRAAGRFRTDRVLISGTRFVPPGSNKFAELIPLMLTMANEPNRHPVTQAAELHYNFVAIHPFGDGNGRTARLLMNLHLMRQGYPITIVPVELRSEYLMCLENVNDGNAKPFSEFVLKCVRNSIQHLIGEE